MLKCSVKELVPKHWHLEEINKEEDIIFLGSISVQEMIEWWRGENNLASPRAIKELLKLKRRAEEKPPLASFRPAGWFKAGDKIVFYNKRKFFLGKINARPENCPEGLISVTSDCGVFTLGAHRVEVLKNWEYDYLKSHPDFAEFWVHYRELKGLSSQQFLEALGV